MHELSLAKDILKIVVAEARRHNLSKVTRINLVAGRHFYLEEKGLRKCWEMVAENSIADTADLVVKLKEGTFPYEFFIESIEGD